MIPLEELWKASKFAEQGEYERAWKIVDEALYEDPNRTPALVLASFIAEKEGNYGRGYNFAKRCTQVAPTEGAGWINLGRCCDWMWRTDEADAAYRQALKYVPDDKSKALVYMNLSSIWAQQGKFRKAMDYAEQSLALNPDSSKAKHNLGMCQLAFGKWGDGWKNYSASVGNSANRLTVQYADETVWQGESDGPVVIYGEQGLGDEINAASMIPDAIEKAQRVIVECDKRLAGLYRRSFPKAKIYGTRGLHDVAWDAEDQSPKYRLSAMQLGELFRPTPESCPGTAYLKADPERVTMWHALWSRKRKHVIGVAWKGGTKNTALHSRTWKLEELLPVFDSIDAHWVCLEYKDASKEIAEFQAKYPHISIAQYPHATLTKDYDDTAALVASLDAVVTTTTTIYHLCGALGKQCAVVVPTNGDFRLGPDESTTGWYDSVELFRRKDGQKLETTLSRVADWLITKYGMDRAA